MYKNQEFNNLVNTERTCPGQFSNLNSKSVESPFFDSSEETGVLNLSSQDDEGCEACTIKVINFDDKSDDMRETKQYAISYSDDYLRIKIAKFIATAKPILQEWSISIGTQSEQKPIKNLLKLIEDFERFFDVKPDSRLLLGTVQNFIIKWNKLGKKHIRHFSSLLSQFNEGRVDKDKLKSFNHEVFLLIDNETEDEKKNEEEE